MSQKQFNWLAATPEQRDAACAAFMPQSDVNPLKSWALYLDGKYAYDVRALNLESAQKSLASALKLTPKKWTELTRFPASLRATAEIRENHHHVRYSDTPGGAWMLIEDLNKHGWTVEIKSRPSSITVVFTLGGIRKEASGTSMSEVIAQCYLNAHGIYTPWEPL